MQMKLTNVIYRAVLNFHCLQYITAASNVHSLHVLFFCILTAREFVVTTQLWGISYNLKYIHI